MCMPIKALKDVLTWHHLMSTWILKSHGIEHARSELLLRNIENAVADGP
jgi:hypothetical protein